MTKDIVISEDWSPKVGGAHFWLENTYRRWPDPVTVLTATEQAPNTEQATDSKTAADKVDRLIINRILISIPTISLHPTEWRPVFSNVLKVRRSLSAKSNRIHCKAFFPEGFLGAIAKRTDNKVSSLIVYAHGEEINVAKSSGLLRQIARWVYGMADLVIVNSRNTEGLVKSLAPNARTTVIHPGVDVASVQSASEKRNDARGKYRCSEETFVVLTIARLEPRKNVVRVIEALDELRQEGNIIRYIVVGKGESLPAIQAKIIEIGAQDWVTLIDHVTEYQKYELLSAADLFVMASIKHGLMLEGFGIVFLEAAAAGLPAISGNDGGQCEAVLDGLTGFNVDGNSTDAIKDVIAKILKEKKAHSLMRMHAEKWARQNDWTEIVSKTISAIN